MALDVRLKNKDMKLWALLISLILSLFCSSCSYRNHLPISSETDPAPRIVSMKVGEKKKIMSKPLLANLSPGFVMGPSHFLRSSDSEVVAVEGSPFDPVALIRAVSPGEASIRYANDGRVTTIVVE